LKAAELEEQIKKFLKMNTDLKQKDQDLQVKYYSEFEYQKNKLFEKELKLKKSLNQ